MAEVDDQRLTQLLQTEELVKRMHNNKETKRDLERLAKKVNPSAVTVDEQLDPYVADIKSELQELREWKAKMNKDIEGYNEAEAIKRLKKSGYTEEGIKAIKGIMDAEGLKIYDIAASWYEKTNPPEPVAANGISPSMWNFQGDGDDDKSRELLNTNADAWQDREIDAWFREQKSNRGDF